MSHQVNLDDVFTDATLRANCKYCHEAGARFSPRAKCGRCDSEAVVITAGSVDAKCGRNRWRDLLTVRVSCAKCDDGPDDTHPVRSAWFALLPVVTCESVLCRWWRSRTGVCCACSAVLAG